MFNYTVPYYFLDGNQVNQRKERDLHQEGVQATPTDYSIQGLVFRSPKLMHACSHVYMYVYREFPDPFIWVISDFILRVIL